MTMPPSAMAVAFGTAMAYKQRHLMPICIHSKQGPCGGVAS